MCLECKKRSRWSILYACLERGEKRTGGGGWSIHSFISVSSTQHSTLYRYTCIGGSFCYVVTEAIFTFLFFPINLYCTVHYLFLLLSFRIHQHSRHGKETPVLSETEAGFDLRISAHIVSQQASVGVLVMVSQ